MSGRAAPAIVLTGGVSGLGRPRGAAGGSLRGRRGSRPHRLEVDVLEGPARDQVGEGGAALGQEGGDRGGDGRGRPAGGLDAVAPGRRLGDRGVRADGSRRVDATSSPGGAPKRDGRARPGAGRGEAVRCALEHDAAGRDDHDAVGHPLRLAELVGGEEDADAPALEPGHDGADGDPPLGVDAGGGLVEEGHLGPPHQGQGEGEALLLATREVAPGGGGDGAQADEVEQLGGRAGDRGSSRRRGRGPAAARASGRRRRAGA